MKRETVGVMGSGTSEHRSIAEPLGRWLAGQNVNLLTGGGGGVMKSVSRSFASVPEREGIIIGVLPGFVTEAGFQYLPGYPNPYVELAITTHLPLSGMQGTNAMSRNHINVLSSDVIVALPGKEGTSTEVELALRYRRPVAAYLGLSGRIPDLPKTVEVFREQHEVEAWVLAALES